MSTEQMSLDPQEEKLFMILQAIEQQSEQNKQTQAIIEQLIKTAQEQQLKLKDSLKVHDDEYKRIHLLYCKVIQDTFLISLGSKIEPRIESSIHQSLMNAIGKAQEHSAKITHRYNEVITENTEVIQQSTENLRRLSLKPLLVLGASIALTFILIVCFIFAFTPSFDEISKRRAELQAINSRTKVQFLTCGKNELCVKVKKNQCYKGNYCAIEKSWF